MQMIKVRYIGKGDSVLTEYDGVKYNFGKSNPVQIIPLAVYNYMQDFQNPHREDIRPESDASVEVEQKKIRTIEDDIEELEKTIETKEEKHENKKGRPKRK